MKRTQSTFLTPAPGYILCQAYTDKDATFTPQKEEQGADQKSIVLAVGPDITDQGGILRTAPCKVGDIILHASTNKDFDHNFVAYRFAHFVEVHGVLNV